MSKHMILWFLAGWAVAFLLPPQKILSYFKKSG
jgi:hypothetical protein